MDSAADEQRVITRDEANFPLMPLTTSGTAGQPKDLYFTHDDQELTIDFFHLGMPTFADPGDRVLILLPGETPSVDDLLAAALTRLSAGSIKHGGRDAATLDVIQRAKINVAVDVSARALSLACYLNTPKLQLKSVLLTPDHVPQAIQQAMEERLACRVYYH